MASDRIEKQIDIAAPVSRVWRALTDHREFGEWFRVKIDAPFIAGQVSRGHTTWPGYEHLKWEALIQKIEPQTLLLIPMASLMPSTRNRTIQTNQ